MTSVFNSPGTTTGFPNAFLPSLLDFLVSSADSFHAKAHADRIISTIVDSRNPKDALWQFWDAFFTAVVCTDPSTPGYATHLAFLNALHAHPPTALKYAPPGSYKAYVLRWHTQDDANFHWSLELPGFHDSWRDAHDSFEGSRHLKGTICSVDAIMAADQLSKTGSTRPDYGQCYLRFCTFSAAVLKASEESGVGLTPMQVFFASRRVLEYERPALHESTNPYSISSRQVWALDVRIAAIWLRDGARSLWNVDQQKLREAWSAAMDETTDLWQRDDGLISSRWQLWAKRLQGLSIDHQGLDAETRELVIEAAKVITSLLNE